MVAETLIGIIYNWVKSSWEVSTVLIKYLILGFLIYELSKRKELSEIEHDLEFYGQYLVAGIVISGLILSVIGIAVEPVIPYVGEFAALLFYGYLFWKY